MGKRSKKPRSKMNPRQADGQSKPQKKEDRDWTFEDIARSKTRRY